jgi:hemerythrin-like domain-containing protein
LCSMTNNAIDIIKKDHREVEELFEEYKNLGERAYAGKRQIAEQVIEALMVHTEMEETLCYPKFKDAFDQDDDALVDEAYIEHEGAKELLEKLKNLKPQDPEFNARMKVLMEQIRHHVKEEEHELLPKAKQHIDDDELEAMGMEMIAFKTSRGVAV